MCIKPKAATNALFLKIFHVTLFGSGFCGDLSCKGFVFKIGGGGGRGRVRVMLESLLLMHHILLAGTAPEKAGKGAPSRRAPAPPVSFRAAGEESLSFFPTLLRNVQKGTFAEHL
jgi:hypothetical protein